MDLHIRQYSPNVPGHKSLSPNPWAVPYRDGYLHIISASHNTETNVLYVRIGCPVLLEDSVREGETAYDAIRRVVYAWQAAEREADHAQALEMHVTEPKTITKADVTYIGSKPHPHNVMPGTMGRMMIGYSRRVREVAKAKSMTVPEVYAGIKALEMYL